MEADPIVEVDAEKDEEVTDFVVDVPELAARMPLVDFAAHPMVLRGLHTEHPTLTIGPCRFIGQFQHTIGTSVVVRAEPNNGRGRGGGAASGAAGTGGSAAASSGDDGFDASAGASESAGATASSSGASAAASSSGGGSAGGHDSGGAAAPATGTHAAPPFVVGMTSRRIVFRLVEGNLDDVCH